MTQKPLHAHVPGQTAHHPDGAFDALRATARPGMAPGELAQCAAFVAGLLYVEDGYNWEACEVLEPVCAALPDGTPDHAAVQAVIRIANARLEARMGNPGAVYGLCDTAEALAVQGRGNGMGLKPARLADWIAATRVMTDRITGNVP